jgi:hypothetical protein
VHALATLLLSILLEAMKVSRNGESHHFVPQFYLRHWCGKDGRLWVWPIDGRKPFKARPKSFAAENGLYDTAGTSQEGFDIEGKLAEVEGLYASRWPGIFDRIDRPETKMSIARFLALLHLRNPKAKDDIRKVNNIFGDIAKEARGKAVKVVFPDGNVGVVRVDDLERAGRNDSEDIRNQFQKNMRSSVEDIAQILWARKWGVIFSEEPHYIASDKPLVLNRGSCRRDKFGLGSPGTVITFPITPFKQLRISDEFAEDGLHYPQISLGDANDGTVLAADRFIFLRELPPVNPMPRA